MSVPDRIGTYWSHIALVRVKRGSTWMSVARVGVELRDPGHRLVPGHRLAVPVRRAGLAVLHDRRAQRVHRELEGRGTLRAEAAGADRAVGVALDVDDVRPAVLGLRVDQGAATDGAVRADAGGLLRPLQLAARGALPGEGEVEAKPAELRRGEAGGADAGQLQELTPRGHGGDGHRTPPTCGRTGWRDAESRLA